CPSWVICLHCRLVPLSPRLLAAIDGGHPSDCLGVAMQLVCPAGSLPALMAAVQQGAAAVYGGLRDDTTARHFAGLNMDDKQLDKGLQLIREKGRQLYIAVNTYAQPQGWERWQRAVDQAADLGVDALIAADPGVLGYASKRYPKLRLHLS